MLAKTIILVIFLFILINLGKALFSLVRQRGQTTQMVKSLTWRIGLSIGLFILLMLGFAFGIIQPHGIVPPH